jgi:hypothetical protein
MPDIVSGYTFVDGEKGVTAGKLNSQISGAVIQPDFVTAKPSSSTLDPTDQLLEVKGAGTYARITGSQLISSVSAQVDATPQIYSVRLRSFNAVQNSTFEVDQKQAGTLQISGSIDRWLFNKSGTMVMTSGQIIPGVLPLLPGTNFLISRAAFQVAVSTAQATLGASDYVFVNQVVEGPQFRELSQDVHSLSLLVYSSVASLKFSIALRDPASAKSLVKLCTTSATQSTWSMISLPNIPVWMSGGNFSSAPGVAGYQLSICLGAGTTFTAPAADTWQNGNFIGAPGMDNFAGKPVNSQFIVAFVQHEPGALCTTPMDKPFTQNYDECLRYFQKTYDYGTKPGTVTNNGAVAGPANANADPYLYVPYKKPVAKVPTVTGYNPVTGAAGSVRDIIGAVDRPIAGVNYSGDSAYAGFSLTTHNASPAYFVWHHTIDTGW